MEAHGIEHGMTTQNTSEFLEQKLPYYCTAPIYTGPPRSNFVVFAVSVSDYFTGDMEEHWKTYKLSAIGFDVEKSR
jgi:hypothetical protein